MGEFVVSAIWPYHNSLILLYSVTLEEYVMRPILLLTADNSPIFTATVVIAGITIVIAVLVLLIFIFQIFGKIAPKIEALSLKTEEKINRIKEDLKAKRAARKKAKQKEDQQSEVVEEAVKLTPIPSAVVPSPSPVIEQGISGEVVAAITAAVVATEGQGAVIRSIKKKNVGGRNPWSHAATIDNTRPF